MENVLKLYKYIDGVNDSPFPNNEEQVVISSFRYDVKRMSGAPSITCTVMHSLCLDKMWVDNIYTTFNGEKFFIKQTASSSYDNTDSRYKHEVELVSERIILDNVYFYDVVQNDVTNDKPVSNSSNVVFFGDIHEFANRLNYSLRYSKVGYSVVVDDGISSEGMMMSFQNQFFSNVLQEIYNTYGIPYYFVGKVIHIGYTNNAITHTFKYGVDESLLSIQKQNANYKVVNRVTGIGSADNIPYYYPNDYESKEEVESNGGTWINPQPNLMPSIYRDTFGKERFYKALNYTYVNPQTGEYYHFENPFIDGTPKEHIVDFENIKPSIVGITNFDGLRIDMFQEFAYDENDNDEVDEEGNYLHPYFFAKLRKFDGEYGFNLFDHSIDENEMVISMTSGSCGACEFIIGVDSESQKNIVQVDERGNLLRDKDGNVVISGQPQDKQNDTINNEVWIALKKDINTFGVIMPNASSNYKPSVEDTFVILHIDLPKAYIFAAEEKLTEQLIKYMAMNNSEKFTFSITFSRIFFAENTQILEKLDENSRIQIEYDNTRYELYVSSYSYSMSDGNPLPEIKVELSDTLTIQQNALQNAISEVKNDIMSSVGSIDWLKLGLKYFLRKDTDDKTPNNLGVGKNLTVDKDVVVGKNLKVDKDASIGQSIHSNVFSSGLSGGHGWAIRDVEYTNSAGVTESRSVLECDDAIIRGSLKVYEFIISQMLGENDNRTFTGMMEVDHYDPETKRVWFDTKDGQLYNPFRVDDIIIVQQYNGNPSSENGYNVIKQYELIVTDSGLGDLSLGENRLDWVTFKNFTSIIDDNIENIIKQKDTFVRIDNLTDSQRKGIIQLMSVGDNTPYMDFIYGAKTDPENSLKARFGNIGGVYNPLFGWLREFGAYISNLYAIGEFKISHTGEDVSDALEVTKGLFRTNYKQVYYDINEETNFFTNASFINNCDGWTLQEDATTFFWNDEVPQFFNNELYVSEDSYAGIAEYDGRDMLRLCNASISQDNYLIKKPSTHKVYEDTTQNADGTFNDIYSNISDTIYLSARIYVTVSGKVEFGFVNANGLFINNSLHYSKELSASEDGYTINLSGIWDGVGDFRIHSTGDVYIEVLSLTDKPLDNFKITTETSLEQTASKIALVGKKTNNVAGSVTDLALTVDAQKEQISSLVTKTNNISNTIITSGWINSADSVRIFSEQVNSQGIAKTAEIQTYVDGKVSGIKLTADNIDISANEFIGIINKGTTTIQSSRLDLVGKVSFNMLDSNAQSTINGKASSSSLTNLQNSLGSLAYKNAVSKALLDSTVISGGYLVTSLIDVNTLVAKKVVTNGDTYGVTTTMADGEISMKTSASVQLLRIYSNGSSSHIGLTDNSSNQILLNPGASSFSFSNGKYLSINPTNGIEFSGGMGIKRFAISSIMTSLSIDGDFCIIGGNYTMPNASYWTGRVIWVYATRDVTLTGSFMNSNGSSASSISCKGMNFFISNGSSWYRGYCQ